MSGAAAKRGWKSRFFGARPALNGSSLTEAWAQFQRIQQFKHSPNALIDGVNYAHVVAIYLYDASKRGLFKKLVFALFFAPRFVHTGIASELLVYYSFRYKHRRDYDYIVDQIKGAAAEVQEFVETTERIAPLQWWFTLRQVPTAARAADAYGSGILEKACVALLIAKFVSIADRNLRDLASDRTTVVTFCDAAPHDNLLSQLAAKRGAVTVTVQHGQYRLLDSTNMSSDAEAYANFISDRMLCWGDATVDEFVRFGVAQERMFTTGWIRHWPKVEVPDVRQGVFGVMLNGINGAESNRALIEAANRLSESMDLRFVLRTHPSYTPAEYARLVNDRCDGIAPMPTADYVASVDFSVSHSSSAAIEMLQVDSPVYVLDDGHLVQVFRRPGLSFGSVKELVEAVRVDANAPDHGRSRVVELKQWFNDDSRQAERIRKAIVLQEE